jgi:hypothetical protein
VSSTRPSATPDESVYFPDLPFKRLSKPRARTPAILVDEFDVGQFERNRSALMAAPCAVEDG